MLPAPKVVDGRKVIILAECDADLRQLLEDRTRGRHAPKMPGTVYYADAVAVTGKTGNPPENTPQ